MTKFLCLLSLIECALERKLKFKHFKLNLKENNSTELFDKIDIINKNLIIIVIPVVICTLILLCIILFVVYKRCRKLKMKVYEEETHQSSEDDDSQLTDDLHHSFPFNFHFWHHQTKKLDDRPKKPISEWPKEAKKS